MDKIKAMLHAIGFWFLIILLGGIFVGGWSIKAYQKSQMQESIVLGGFVFEKKIYDIRLRP